jgi:septum site-determining protein MinD
MMGLEDVVDILAIDVLGIVPDDEAIVVTTNRGEAAVAVSNSGAGAAFRNIAQRIINKDVPMREIGQEESFVARLKRFFRKGSKAT